MRRWAMLRIASGILVWCLFLGWVQPTPFEWRWAAAMLLLAVLLLVPMLLELLGREHQRLSECWSWGGLRQIHAPAALCLCISFLLPPNWFAGLLSLPWLFFTFCLAFLGFWRLWVRGVSLAPELAFDSGFVLILVGGLWSTAFRFGVRPAGFADIIVLLTAVHFHFAGFVLPLLTSLVSARVPFRLAQAAVFLVVVPVPLVAVGIVSSHLQGPAWLEAVAACAMASGGLLIACLHISLGFTALAHWSSRLLWGIAGFSLLCGMVLASLYGLRHFVVLEGLDLSRMWAFHGSLNALGFGLCGVSGWWLESAFKRVSPSG